MSTETLLQPAGSLSRTDVIKFAYFHYFRRFWPLTAACLAVSLFGLLVVLSTGDPERLQNPGLSYLFLLILALVQFGVPYVNAWRQYSRTQFLREAMRFHFTREKIWLEGPSFSGEISWSLVKAAYETKNSFLIYQTDQMAWILPKRFFWGDSALVAQCRQLMSQRLVGPRRFHSTSMFASWF